MITTNIQQQLTILIAIIGLGSLSACNTASNQSQSANRSSSADTSTISVLQTADYHGQIEEHDEFFWEDNEPVFKRRAGMDHIKSLVDSVRAENPTVLVDGGDMIQGSGASVLSKGEIFPPLVREMDYDVMIPGNWGVVYGKERMMNIMNDYEANVLAANIYHEGTNDLVFKPYWTKEVNGVKLGFIGYDDPDVPTRQNPEFSEGLKFTKLDQNLPKLVDELRNEKDVDVLFVLTHMGISKQTHLANDPMAKGVDYILGNDTHERVRELLEGKYAKVAEPGAFGSFVGRLDLKIADGQLVGHDYDLMEVDPNKYPSNEAMATKIEKVKAPYEDKLNRVLGYTKKPLYRYLIVQNPMDNMITDAAKWKTGVDVALSNGFRFSPPLVPGDKDSVAITKEYLWSMLPVNDQIKVAEASGEQIENWLEEELHNVFADNLMERFGGWFVKFSGMTVRFNSDNAKGERLISVSINGEPLQKDKMYTMSACKRPGDPMDMLCRMDNVKDPEILDYTIHEAVEDYLDHKGTVKPTLDSRAKAVDLGKYALSQLPGTGYEFR